MDIAHLSEIWGDMLFKISHDVAPVCHFLFIRRCASLQRKRYGKAHHDIHDSGTFCTGDKMDTHPHPVKMGLNKEPPDFYVLNQIN